MRAAAPIGVFADTAEVIDRCRLQAKVTHNTPDGRLDECSRGPHVPEEVGLRIRGVEELRVVDRRR